MESFQVLLDSICPNAGCNVPIFRSRERANAQYLCCLCDHPTSPWKPHGQEQLRSPAAPVEATNSETSIRQGYDGDGDDEFIPRDVSASSSAARAEADRTSALMGKRLLQGWAMLADPCEDCPGVPLMRKNGVVLCVGCGQETQQMKEDVGARTHVEAPSRNNTLSNSCMANEAMISGESGESKKRILPLSKEEGNMELKSGVDDSDFDEDIKAKTVSSFYIMNDYAAIFSIVNQFPP